MSKKDDRVYIKYIIESIENIEKFVKDVTYKDFSEDVMRYSAVIRMLEIIGEATVNISDELKIKYEEIPWRIMKDMRNFLIHQYFGVDLKTLWDTIENDLPDLKKNIMNIED